VTRGPGADVRSTPVHSVSVAGVVIREDGRILVIERRDDGRWEPPGGVLELGETLEEGVRREVGEETGVEVVVERLTGVYKNMSRRVVALVFRCQPVGGAVTETDEAQRVHWFTMDEVRQRMAPVFAVRVDDALRGDVVVRAHDGIRLIAG
jgi:8-oxo-dGTP diphosphatase